MRIYREIFADFLLTRLQSPVQNRLNFRNILLSLVLENTDSEALRDLIIHELENTNRQFQKPAVYLQGCIKKIKIAVNNTRIFSIY